VFYVSPPTQNQLKQSVVDLIQKSFEENQPEPQEQPSSANQKEVE